MFVTLAEIVMREPLFLPFPNHNREVTPSSKFRLIDGIISRRSKSLADYVHTSEAINSEIARADYVNTRGVNIPHYLLPAWRHHLLASAISTAGT